MNYRQIRLLRLVAPHARGRGLLASACLLAIMAAAPAQAAEARRCGPALLAASARVVRTDLRALGDCAFALRDPRAGGHPSSACKALRSKGSGLDRNDRRTRRRIERACGTVMPAWLPHPCLEFGPGLIDAAACAARRAHCTAATLFLASLGDIREELTAQHADNWSFEFGGIEDNSFAACPGSLCLEPPCSASTTTTLPAPPTTSSTSTTTSPPSTTTSSTTSSTTTTQLATTSTTTSTTMRAPETSTSTTTTVTVTSSTTTTTTTTVTALALRVSEYLSNPVALPDGEGEFFELVNLSPQSIDMKGMRISDDGSDSFEVSGPLVVEPGGHVVFGRSESAAGGAVDYVYASRMTLANSADEIVISHGGEELDRVSYGAGWPLLAGRSTQRDPSAMAAAQSDLPQNWCSSATPMPDGDFGTPGDTNQPCP